MSAPTPSSNELSKLRENWASRQGSAKGQYRMSHRDAGILFSEVERLQRAIVDRDRKLAECSIEIFNLESDKKRAAVEPRASSECPICGVDTPHAHGPREICRWLEHQAATFNLEVEVLDKTAHKGRLEFLKSAHGQFEQFVSEMGVAQAADRLLQLWLSYETTQRRLDAAHVTLMAVQSQATCVCGHGRDEHFQPRKCTIECCKCDGFRGVVVTAQPPRVQAISCMSCGCSYRDINNVKAFVHMPGCPIDEATQRHAQTKGIAP